MIALEVALAAFPFFVLSIIGLTILVLNSSAILERMDVKPTRKNKFILFIPRFAIVFWLLLTGIIQGHLFFIENWNALLGSSALLYPPFAAFYIAIDKTRGDSPLYER